MRRSKSNPAKYARNYRAISTRRMSQYDDMDEEGEMERLKNILKHSENHLKQYNNDDNGSDDDDDDDDGDSNKRKKTGGKNKDPCKAEDQEKPPLTTAAASHQGDSNLNEADKEKLEIERARALLRNSTDHISNTPQEVYVNDDAMQLKLDKTSKKRRRKQATEEGIDDKEKDERMIKEDVQTTKPSETVNSSTNDSTNESSLCTEEFIAENRIEGSNDDLVLPSKKKKKTTKKRQYVELSPEEIRDARKLHKKTERKLKQLATRAEQKKKRENIYQKLKETAITAEEMALMSSSSTLGKRVSKKEQLKRLVQKERAGILLTDEERDLLYRDRGIAGDNDNVNDDAEHDGIESTDTKDDAQKLSKATKSRSVCGDSGNDEGQWADKKNNVGKPKESRKVENYGNDGHSSGGNRDAASATSLEQNGNIHDEPESAASVDATKSFAAQMMASLSSLKASSEKQKQEIERRKEQELEQQRLEEERLRKASKAAPYKVRDPVVIPSANSKRKLKVHALPASSKRILNVERPAEVQESRYDLPVTQMEFEVIDAIRNNDVTIICGETGSGKSTQVPQLLYESGFTLDVAENLDNQQSKFLIGVTQPRRVAAVSTAKRVCFEMGKGDGRTIKSTSKGKQGNLVAYQTRYETAGLGQNTAVKFMTDGILLQEIKSDLLLRKYSVIVLDECHERNLNCGKYAGINCRSCLSIHSLAPCSLSLLCTCVSSDILCGLIGLALPLRKKASDEPGSTIPPLKLIIMSATLRVEDFLDNPKIFRGMTPCVVKIPGRTFPVTIHHSKVTELDNYGEFCACRQCVCFISLHSYRCINLTSCFRGCCL